jgi:hypothetical protein
MKRLNGLSVLLVSLVIVSAGIATAQSFRTTPGIESQFRQAITAVESEQYIRATQLLTRLVGLPEHVHSRRAQELLGNVREANGQFAHAVAEYEIYLEQYPEGPGATRVGARLSSILGGATPLPRQPDITAVIGDRSQTAQPSRPRFGRGARPGSPSAAAGATLDPNATTVTNRGSVRLTYRFNEGATEIVETDPFTLIPTITDDETDVLDNALTASLQYARIIENGARKVTLSFSGSVDVDFEDSEEDFRLYELSAVWEDKGSGRVLSFGRHRLKPSGIAYRLDGASLKWPAENGVVYGVFAGVGVNSTRDDLFEDDAVLVGASASLPKGVAGPGELTGYFVEEREDSFANRRAIGAEYALNLDNGSVFVNAEADLKLGELNRALVTGTRNLPNNARVTARLAHYRSPALSLQNALIGQSAASLSDLSVGITEVEMEDLALDRSAKVTTFGFTYYGPVNDAWNLSAFGSLYHTSGTPESSGLAGADDVAAVAAEGVRSYVGARLIGSSVFRDKDQVSVGLRYAGSDDNVLYVATSSMRLPMNEDLTIRPRIRIGYRDYEDGSIQKFVIPSINARYKFNRQTSLQIEVGGRWSKDESALTTTKEKQFFFSAGVSRSF